MIVLVTGSSSGFGLKLPSNTGVGLRGAVEAVSDTAAKELFETNFFGALRNQSGDIEWEQTVRGTLDFWDGARAPVI